MAEDQWIGLTATKPFVETPGKPKRRLLARAPGLILEELWYQGGADTPHSHDGHSHDHPQQPSHGAHSHELVSAHYILSGRFSATVGSSRVELGPGDCFVAPPGVDHQLECLVTGSALLIRTEAE